LVVADKLFHIAADNEPIVEKAIQERSPKTKTETNNEKQAYTHIYRLPESQTAEADAAKLSESLLDAVDRVVMRHCSLTNQ